MDPREFAAAQDREARRVTVRVRQVVAREGAPVTPAQREAMASTLLPVVKRSRVRVRDLGVEFMQSQAENVGESLEPQPIRDYEQQALVKVLERVTGVPDDGTNERRRVSVTMADPKTRSDVRKRVTVTEENRNDAVVKKVVGDRAAATVERHVRNAAREAVSDAAELAGSEVGWARVLSGAESCTFCAMLASRGPAYNSAEAAGFVTQRSGRYDSREAKAYHDNCVVPGTMVSGPDSHTGYRRHYEGEIVTLVTASGNELTITPKHPVLTNRGWVRAGELNVGDKLVSAVRADRNVVSGPDVDHVPSAIENVVSALGMVGSSVRRSVPGSAEQFHGDGFASEVDVVMADYLLRRERDTSLVEPDAELLFHGTSVPSASLCSRCSGIGELDELRIAAGATTDGRMRRSSLLDTLLRGESGSSVLSRLAAVTGRQSGLSYPAGHDGSTDSVLLGQRKNAVSGLVTTGEIAGNWDSSRRPVGVSRKFNPPELQSVTKTLRVFAELGTDLRERLSGSVHLDDLVDKRVGVYHGDVLNLGTQEGWYSANNITVSNCDCIVVPVFDGEPWYGQEHYELLEELWIESTRGLSAPDSTKAFAAALKKTNLTKLPDAENDNAAAAVDVVSQQRVVEPKADERRATAARKPKEAAPLDAFAARAAMERERERRFRELGLQPTPAEFEIDNSIPTESAQRARGQYLSIPESARDVLRTAGVRIGVAPNTDTLFGRTAANRRSLTADGRALGTTSHYSPADNAVYLAAQDVGRYASGSANVVAHESGHALDYNVLRLNPVTVAWQSPGEAEARYRPRYVHEDPYLMWAHNEFVYPNADIDDYYRTGSQGFAKSGRQEWVAEGFAAMVEGDDALLERISGGSRGADIFRWTMRRLGML